MQALERKLESVFRRIEQERMRDLSFCNPALQVSAVGFQVWNDDYLGVLLTPWFMNLMLLPREPQALEGDIIGSKCTRVFPSGRYEFILSEEAELGRYLVCSLFSPVFEFEDQQTALSVARLSLEGLMAEENRDPVSTHEKAITRLWHGESEAEDTDGEASTAAPIVPAAPRKTEMSRRDFLRGEWRDEQAGAKGQGGER
jgi:[NiFe] hydrogenase assembly HybE family chaperone